MRERKVIELLQHFSKKDLKNLKRFVESPYFNTNVAIIALYEYIYKFAPDFNHSNLTIEKAFKSVFPNKKFEERIITRLISKLFKLVEQYIVQMKLEEKELQQKFLLLDFYIEKQLSKFFDSANISLRKSLEEFPFRDDDYFYYKYVTEYYSAKFLSKLDDRTNEVNINNTVKSFDSFYWIRKIMLLSLLINRNNVVANSGYDLSEVNFVIEKLKDYDFSELPSLYVWYRALILLNDPGDVDAYQKLKIALSTYDHLFSSEIIQNLYVFLINSVVILFQDGENRFQEYFSLFSEQIAKGHIYDNGHLYPQMLKNIMTVALRLKKHQWAEDFLKENKEKILPKEVYHWNLGKLYYATEEYDKALEILEENKYDDIYYVLETKRLLLKIYYQLGYAELMYSYINSFRVFLSRKAIISKEKKRNQNFVNFFQQLLKLVPRDKEKKNGLLEKLKQEEEIADKDWLLEKIQTHH